MTRSRPALRMLGESPRQPEAPGEPDPLPDAEVSQALRDLLARFDAFVRRTASRHGLSGGDLDEVVQDLRVRIWRSFGTAEAIRRASATFMYRAAVSASLDIIRRRRARKASALSLESLSGDTLTDARPGGEEHVTRDELARAVHDALGLLAESRRAVVRMYLAGYDRFEIAALLGWSEGRTRNLLYRGLDDLRQVLAARGITKETRP